MKITRWIAALAGLLVVTAPFTSRAQDLPRHVFAVSPDEEVQDLLFLGDTRPVLIRLHIRIDGEGHQGRWLEFVRRSHAQADTNADGFVSRVEANNVIDRVYQLQSSTLLNPQLPPPQQRPIAPSAVGVADLADQMRTVLSAFQIERQVAPAPSNDEATFRLLDRNGDGYLSNTELAVMITSLARLDLDDDETITAEELGPYRNPALNNLAVVQTPAVANPAENMAVISISGERPQDVARRIIRRYDKGSTPAGSGPPSTPNRAGTIAQTAPAGDAILKAEELAIGPEAFARIDSNRDGSIDAHELESVVTNAVDLELIVRLGRREPGESMLDRFEGPGGPSPFGVPLVRWSRDLALIAIATTTIELGTEANGTDPFAAARANFDVRYRSADLDNNGYVDKTEARRLVPPTTPWDQLDRDGDGKLTEIEWHVYFDRVAEVLGLQTVLRTSEQGPSFLSLLDEDQDRRLSRRELQGAAKRLLTEDRDGDGLVSLGEFARHHRWTIARGRATAVVQPPIVVDQRRTRPDKSVVAPEWFVKMDRNRDGDVSPREFLGTRSAFEDYDTDRDNLIDPREANRRPR